MRPLVFALAVVAVLPVLGAGNCGPGTGSAPVVDPPSGPCSDSACGMRPAVPPRVCQDPNDGMRSVEGVGACARDPDTHTCEWQVTTCADTQPAIACQGPGNSCPDGMACIDGFCFAGEDCRGGDPYCSGDAVCCQSNFTCVSVHDWGACPVAVTP